MEIVLASPISASFRFAISVFSFVTIFCPVNIAVSHSSATPCSILLFHFLFRFVHLYHANLKYLIFTLRKYSKEGKQKK